MLLKSSCQLLTEKSEIWEYKVPAPGLSLGSAIINDRYPAKGFGQNLESDQLFLVFEGEGEIETRHETIKVQKGNSILISQMQEYFIQPKEGQTLMLWVVNNPKWTPEQYRVEE